MPEVPQSEPVQPLGPGTWGGVVAGLFTCTFQEDLLVEEWPGLQGNVVGPSCLGPSCRIEIPYPGFSSAHHRQAIWSCEFTDEVPCGVWPSCFPRESGP